MSTKSNYSRRDFLKVVGATTGVAAMGCGKDVPEKLIPYVIQPNEVIPGVPVWYAGTCSSCSSGCGVVVKTREGRAIKVEGNAKHPVNTGGLCALGHSALQTLYDPDRVREPLKRDLNGSFKPISWKQAVAEIGQKLKELSANKKEGVFITSPLSGSAEALVKSFTEKVAGLSVLEYEALSRELLDSATEKVFGKGLRARYDLSDAKVILSVGADFLETWLSPVEFARDFAKNRKPQGIDGMSYFVQVEPRLSPTGGNADRWIANTPGSETGVLLAVLKAVVERNGTKGLSGEELSQVKAFIQTIDEGQILKDSGVSLEVVRDIAARLVKAKSSVVLVGGTAVNDQTAYELGFILNACLGNIGESVKLYSTDKTQTGLSAKLHALIEKMSDKTKPVSFAFLSNVNPVYSLPQASNFAKALSNVEFVVALSTNLDETARFANIVLPLSTNFETWDDSEPRPGVFNLNQPAMQPLYLSQSLGETLFSLSVPLGIEFGATKTYLDYIKNRWKDNGSWEAIVAGGGSFAKVNNESRAAKIQKIDIDAKKATRGGDEVLTLLAYTTVGTGDGSGANRPWLQELPNVITTAVWGSTAVLHPETAKKLHVSQGDVLQVVTDNGSVEAPAFVFDHIAPNVLALPLGQGHDSMGRYANGVGANVFKVLPFSSETGVSYVVPNVQVRHSVSGDKLVVTQMQNSELGRGIVRNVAASTLLAAHTKHKHGDHHTNGHGDEGHGGGHGGGHGHGHALGPQPEPKQMYKQMPHPVYRWGMSIDLASCTGCQACVVSCYAENNIPVVGKELCDQGREMSWLKIDRYFDGPADKPITGFMPLLCQHCGNAPCEPVCPVYATYHNEEGLNTMVYNRCVGTRYCGNNCSYKVRRFNWFKYEWPEPLNLQLNPDITTREVGVMEKCTFCVQRIKSAQQHAKDEGRLVKDGEVQPACAQSCPTGAIKFGNLLDEGSEVYKNSQSERAYKVLDAHLNTQPAISYLARVENDLDKV